MSDPTTVLLADDHPSILAAVSKHLASNGIDVVALAGDGHEALDAGARGFLLKNLALRRSSGRSRWFRETGPTSTRALA